MSGRRLDSWKEIAAYLNRDVATVRRWEKRERLPVHRHLHQKLGSVYAFTSELDAWLEQRRGQVEQQPSPRSRRPGVFRVITFVGLILAVVGAASLLRDATSPAPRPLVRLAVHRPGTIAGALAAGLGDILRRAMPGAEIALVEQPGMMGTLRAISEKQVDVGLACNLVAFHAAKTDLVLGRPDNEITALTVGYATPAQILVRRDSDIASVADLRQKRVSFGISESGERFCSQILMSHLGFADEDVSPQFIDFAPSLQGLRERGLDAYITWRGMPVPDLSLAFTSGEFRLIPVDADALQGLRLKHPFLVPWTIPARVYAHQSSAVPTVSARMLLVGARSLPVDVVDRILRAIDAHMPDLIARHPAASEFLVKRRPTLADGLSIDLHAGADRFFDSISTP